MYTFVMSLLIYYHNSNICLFTTMFCVLLAFIIYFFQQFFFLSFLGMWYVFWGFSLLSFFVCHIHMYLFCFIYFLILLSYKVFLLYGVFIVKFSYLVVGNFCIIIILNLCLCLYPFVKYVLLILLCSNENEGSVFLSSFSHRYKNGGIFSFTTKR